MLRRVIGVMLVAWIIAEGAAFAQTKSSASSRSATRRVVWTIVGAGAGFGTGLFLGLNKFDDSVNSDRKVWTSALVGALAGGVAGGLLSANRKRESSAFDRRKPFTTLPTEYGPKTLADVARPDPIWTINVMNDR
jgi:hypothetical protein